MSEIVELDSQRKIWAWKQCECPSCGAEYTSVYPQGINPNKKFCDKCEKPYNYILLAALKVKNINENAFRNNKPDL